MKIINPNTITEAMIVSSSVAEPDTSLSETAWSATEICADGEQRYVGAPSSGPGYSRSCWHWPAWRSW